MIPILYESTETDFIHNGIARLSDCISAVVSEERNGVYELNFQYPVTGAHFADIVPGRIVGVTHDDSGDVQPFDIVGYQRDIDGIVTFHAVHISYRLSFITVTGGNINSLADALALMATGTPENRFTFAADFTSSAYMAGADGLPHTVKQMLGGIKGSILDTYGGEYTWDRFKVILQKSRGIERDFAIRYGVNMTAFSDEADASETYNAAIPYWHQENTGTVIGSKVISGQAMYSNREACIPLDLTDKFEAQPTAAQLQAAAEAYMQEHETASPHQTINISFVRLQDYAGQEELAELMQCGLCDKITVIFPGYGIQEKFKIVKTTWDVLEDRYTEMELGALQTTLAQALGVK